MCDTPEYHAWSGMIQRCTNPNCKTYEHYGGRGIKVCWEWESSFLRFLKHIGKRPGPEYSLDRIDNDGDYEPLNVRWATKQQQAANKSRDPKKRESKQRLEEFCEYIRSKG